jgi:hypothetical protein
MKALQNLRLVRHSKTTDCRCAFSWNACNKKVHFTRSNQSSSSQGYDGIHRSWDDIISWEKQWPTTKTKWTRSLYIEEDCLKTTELLQQRWEQNSIFMWKAVSTKTVRQELTNSTPTEHQQLLNLWLLKTTLKERKKKKRWTDDDKTWMSDYCKYIICSDASPFMLFPTSGRTPKEANNLECLVQTVKHGGGSVKYLSILLVP